MSAQPSASSLRSPFANLPGDLARALAQGPLVRAATGSRLHGFANAASDHDVWVVVPEPRDHTGTLAGKKVFQSVERYDDRPAADVTVVGLSTWLHYCANGVPQALDVMFASEPHVEVDRLTAMRSAYRANPNETTATFRRKMRKVVEQRVHDPKQRRHAARMALNLLDVQRVGRYDPTLSPEARAEVLRLAATASGFRDRLEALTGMALRSP